MNKLVLLDLDKTIIDSAYKLPIPEETFIRAIAFAQSCGVATGLNSDSPERTLNEYSQKWSLSGPTICERGAFIINGDSKVVVNVDATGFMGLRYNFINALSEQTDPRTLVVLGDVNDLASSEQQFGCRSSKRIVLVNGLRTHSLSYFVRVLDGALINDQRSSESVFDLFRGCVDNCLPANEFEIDLNHEYGFCGIHHRDTTKTNGVQVLRGLLQQSGNRPRIYMVGDSMADHIELEGVINCAVANASSAFKARCDFVASRELARGVIEILEWVVRQ